MSGIRGTDAQRCIGADSGLSCAAGKWGPEPTRCRFDTGLDSACWTRIRSHPAAGTLGAGQGWARAGRAAELAKAVLASPGWSQVLKEHVAARSHIRGGNVAVLPITRTPRCTRSSISYNAHCTGTGTILLEDKLQTLEQALRQYRLPVARRSRSLRPSCRCRSLKTRYPPLTLSPQRQTTEDAGKPRGDPAGTRRVPAGRALSSKISIGPTPPPWSCLRS